MKDKMSTSLKEIFNMGVSSQHLIVIILFGGFAFLIQATISREQSSVIGYVFYVLLASLFFMFIDWKEHKRKNLTKRKK